MEELSIEEKAKAYDKALERAKECHTDGLSLHQPVKDVLEHIFPELKESEDERIRKELIKEFKELNHRGFPSFGRVKVDSILAWLEKQEEHANFRNKIQIGDKVTRNKDGVLVNLSQLNRVAKKQEQKSTPKLTEFEDAIKDMMDDYRDAIDDNAATVEEVKEHAAYLLSLIPQKSAEWSEDDEKILNLIIARLHSHPNVEAEEYGKDYHWLKFLKHQNSYAYNPYKTVVESIAAMVEKYATSDSDLQDFYNNVKVKCKDAKEYDSLYPQSTWKPSDYQIEALESATENCSYSEYQDCLRELIRQLKKLREE